MLTTIEYTWSGVVSAKKELISDIGGRKSDKGQRKKNGKRRGVCHAEEEERQMLR